MIDSVAKTDVGFFEKTRHSPDIPDEKPDILKGTDRRKSGLLDEEWVTMTSEDECVTNMPVT